MSEAVPAEAVVTIAGFGAFRGSRLDASLLELDALAVTITLDRI